MQGGDRGVFGTCSYTQGVAPASRARRAIASSRGVVGVTVVLWRRSHVACRIVFVSTHCRSDSVADCVQWCRSTTAHPPMHASSTPAAEVESIIISTPRGCGGLLFGSTPRICLPISLLIATQAYCGPRICCFLPCGAGCTLVVWLLCLHRSMHDGDV